MESVKGPWLKESPKNILLRMPNWLGDLVMATPVIKDLRHAFPDAAITAMCQANVAPMLERDPHITEIFTFSRPSGWLRRAENRDLIGSLSAGKYDLGVLLTNSLSSAYWMWRGQVKNRLGYTGHFRSWLLDKALPFPEARETQHLVMTYKQLLAPLQIPLSDTNPYLEVGEDEEAAVWERLNGLGIEKEHIIVGINPGAAYGSAKCWLPDRYREVAERLIAMPNVRVVFFGDRAGAEPVHSICVGLPETVVNLAAKTSLRELVTLIKCCGVFVTNDSGPMHIAAAVGTPLLALFGSTNDVSTGPYNLGKVIHKHVECSPCYKRECPIDFRCMTRIGVDEVHGELMGLIEDAFPDQILLSDQ